MNGSEALADALLQEGVECVFAVSGEDNMLMLTELIQSKKARVIKTRREAGAVSAADGYSRATGKPGVFTVTCGPGLGNTANGLIAASRRKSSVICIAPEPNLIPQLKGLDQRRFAEAVEARYVHARLPETLATDIQAAFRHVRSGAGPVVLGVPVEIMYGQLDYEWEYRPSDTVLPQVQRVQPDPELVERAAAILRDAQRPVIIAGRGAVAAGAQEEVRALAERTGSLLATTLEARGFLGDHPYQLGISGCLASDLAHSLLREAACLGSAAACIPARPRRACCFKRPR